MKIFKFHFAALAALGILALAAVDSSAAPDKTEEELINILRHDQNYNRAIDALEKLPKWYPNSTNAVLVIKGILVRQAPVLSPYVPSNIVTRKAARALGEYHASLAPEEFNVMRGLLRSQDPETKMDALKGLRGMKAPEAVPEILPLLGDENDHVKRDACRTLAVLGTKENIPAIEPLLKHGSSSVRKDAKLAIEALKAKP